MKKRGSRTKQQVRMNRAIKETSSVMLPLLDLFSVLDDIYTEEDALSQEHIHQSAGRAFRAWKEARAALDPEFDPNNYQKRPRRAGTNPSSPLATGFQNSSSDQKSISAKSRKRRKKPAKTSAKGSARSVRSNGPA